MPRSPEPRIDAYIADAAAFARPILSHLRQVIRSACPEAEETMKWSSPFFTLDGKILCHMAAFKAHAVFGFWYPDLRRQIARDLGKSGDAMGVLGRLTSLSDLPSDSTLRRYLRLAAELTRQAHPPRRPPVKKKAPLAAPADLVAGLKKRQAAAAAWETFSPSKQRDYIEWITEAKREETRRTRLATALAWIAEGKARHWKYERC